ncbi:MAG: hypothetical protein EXR28_02000 [Betaproteobacteria bacterium]|nr:hypothetical protein [Betaproteobacteria bacterium]
MRRFYYDTAASTKPVIIEALKRLVGHSQIVFGTDFLFGTSAGIAASMRNTGLSTQEMVEVDRGNAARVFARA